MRIKALENQLNTRLLYRDSRGVEITPAGQRLLQHARVILRQVDHLKHDFQEQADGDAGHIHLRQHHGGHRVHARPAGPLPGRASGRDRGPAGAADARHRARRARGTTDLGIVAGPVDAPELQAIHFSTDRLVLVTPATLQDRAKVKLTEAVSHPFITMHEGSTLVAFLREQLEMAGQRLPQRIQLYSFDSICRMVQAGVGVGVIPDSAARRYRQPGLRVVELDEPWVVRERKLLLRDIDALPGCARELIAQIQESRDESGDTARPDEAVRASAKPRAAAKTPAARTPAAGRRLPRLGLRRLRQQAASGKIPAARGPLKSR